MKKYPTVNFQVLSPEDTLGTISSFLHPGKDCFDWSKAILNCYPSLEKKIAGAKNRKNEDEIIYKFFLNLRKEKKDEIDEIIKKLKSGWDKIDNEVFEALSEIIEVDLSNKETITVSLSFNPICPRDIDSREFLIYMFSEKRHMLSIMIHEISHFYFFNKFKEIFPKISNEKYNIPHIEWYLSELVIESVLNDARMQKIFKYDFKTYDEFQNLRVENKLLLAYIKELYESRKNFEAFVRRAYDFVKVNEERIRGCV